MYESINEVLRNSFYHDPAVEARIAEYEKRVLEDKISSFIAAKELLDILFQGFEINGVPSHTPPFQHFSAGCPSPKRNRLRENRRRFSFTAPILQASGRESPKRNPPAETYRGEIREQNTEAISGRISRREMQGQNPGAKCRCEKQARNAERKSGTKTPKQ